MELEFHQQQIPESITVRDIIELYNCEDHGMNGMYAVAQLDPDGSVMLIGLGEKSGYITMIQLG